MIINKQCWSIVWNIIKPINFVSIPYVAVSFPHNWNWNNLFNNYVIVKHYFTLTGNSMKGAAPVSFTFDLIYNFGQIKFMSVPVDEDYQCRHVNKQYDDWRQKKGNLDRNYGRYGQFYLPAIHETNDARKQMFSVGTHTNIGVNSQTSHRATSMSI